jgi:hypothetical protein
MDNSHSSVPSAKGFTKKPVFLVGAERSGTTLFRLMLAQHPDVAVCPEFENVFDPLAGKKTWPETPRFLTQLKGNWIFQDQGFSINSTLSVPKLISSFLTQCQQKKNVEQVLAVVHRHIEVIDDIWKDARYIHIVRDPRDVARSNVAIGWAGNIWHGVSRWVEVEKAWDKLKKQLPDNAYIEVSQEELIRSPEQVLSQVCSFMGIGYHSDMLTYPQASSYSKPDSSLTQQWKTKLTAKEIQLVEARVGDLLLQRGYSPSGLDDDYPGIITRLGLLSNNKIRKLLFRIDFYGLQLYFAELLSRRLRLSRWQKHLEPQLYAKWRSSLK